MPDLQTLRVILAQGQCSKSSLRGVVKCCHPRSCLKITNSCYSPLYCYILGDFKRRLERAIVDDATDMKRRAANLESRDSRVEQSRDPFHFELAVDEMQQTEIMLNSKFNSDRKRVLNCFKVVKSHATTAAHLYRIPVSRGFATPGSPSVPFYGLEAWGCSVSLRPIMFSLAL